jgi:hypothetical protein
MDAEILDVAAGEVEWLVIERQTVFFDMQQHDVASSCSFFQLYHSICGMSMDK